MGQLLLLIALASLTIASFTTRDAEWAEEATIEKRTSNPSNSVQYCAEAGFKPPCLSQIVANEILDKCLPVAAPYGFTSIKPIAQSPGASLVVSIFSDLACRHKVADSISTPGVADLHTLPGNKNLDTSPKTGQFAIIAHGQATGTTIPPHTTANPPVSTIVDFVYTQSGGKTVAVTTAKDGKVWLKVP